MKFIFSNLPFKQSEAIGFIRIVVGALLIYHGQEVFNSELMASYSTWESFKGTPAKLMVYAGKSSELIAGIFFLLGLFTRLGALLTIGTFSYITFFIGHGKFWYEDQHPFMFILIGLLFLFTGPGVWSLDERIVKK
jgi:putative oxidoreductase